MFYFNVKLYKIDEKTFSVNTVIFSFLQILYGLIFSFGRVYVILDIYMLIFHLV